VITTVSESRPFRLANSTAFRAGEPLASAFSMHAKFDTETTIRTLSAGSAIDTSCGRGA
jgi:hypothetical protein